MMILALFSWSPSGARSRAMACQSPFLAVSGLGQRFRNFHKMGIAAFPVVLLRNMVATKSFHGSWYRLSWMRWNGDLGGVHLTSRCSSGRGMYLPPWKYGLWTTSAGAGTYSSSSSTVKQEDTLHTVLSR